MNALRCLYNALAHACRGFAAGWREERAVQALSRWYEAKVEREKGQPESVWYGADRRNAGHVS